MAGRSRARVCGRSFAGVASLNPYSLTAEYLKARYQCSSEMKYIGSNPGVGVLLTE